MTKSKLAWAFVSVHKWCTIVVALLLPVFAIAGQAKAEVLFAAVWEQGGGPAFQARHNLTAAQYQQNIRPASRPGLPAACAKRICSRRRAALRRPLGARRWPSLSSPAQLNHRTVSANI
jgi:Polyglycine hydrolase-like, structural repeat